MKRVVAIVLVSSYMWSCSNNADSKTGTDTANSVELPRNRDVDTVSTSGGGGDTASYEGMSGKMQGMDSSAKGMDSTKK